jgi:hypothetical protein
MKVVDDLWQRLMLLEPGRLLRVVVVLSVINLVLSAIVFVLVVVLGMR